MKANKMHVIGVLQIYPNGWKIIPLISLEIDMATAAQLQQRLDSKFYGEMIITTETLTAQAIKDGKLRVANYGDECDTGTTYFIGTLSQVEEYINSITR
jgi:hypothetical protein